jgi:RNA polymerase sigma-70 factor (ECF subfamily)
MAIAQNTALVDPGWSTAWTSCAPGLRRVARRLTRDADDAEDLLQETAVRAHRFADRFREGTCMRAWLHRILRNTFASRYRKRRREREVIERAHSEGALYAERARASNEEPRVVAASLSDEVMRALEALPTDFRAVLELVVIDGLSYREAADRLGCPIGTVMSRLHRARAAMVANLSPELGADLSSDRAKAKAQPRAASTPRRPRVHAEKTEAFGGFVTRRAA